MRSMANRIVAILFISALTASPLLANDGDKGKQPEGIKFKFLPLIAASSDDGLGLGIRLFLTNFDAEVAPYKWRAFAQYYKTSLGFEFHELNLDMLRFFGTPFRVKFSGGLERRLNSNWYGIGNTHDIRRIQRVQKGEIPINENLPGVPDLLQVDDNVTVNRNCASNFPNCNLNSNLPRRVLRESQNKYYKYDYIAPFANISTEDFFGKSNFLWFVGFEGRRVRIQSYEGDTEAGNTTPNIKTLLDIQQPLGYNATEDPKFVNGIRLALGYDSRPRIRERNPNSGVYADFHVTSVSKATGAAYDFTRYTATWRQYLEVISGFPELVFAYRLQLQETTGDVPFFEMGRIRSMNEEGIGIGGNRGVRGYPNNQFVDRVFALTNFELRYSIKRWAAIGGIDLVLIGYYDVGRVAPTKKDLSLDGLHKAAGGGIRLVWGKDTVVNITTGRSQYESNFNFSFGHMF